MDDLPLENQIASLDIFSAKKLRAQLTKRISSIRVSDTIRLETKISAEKKIAMDLTIDWLHSKKFIPSKTKYGFLKFAVENTMKLVLDQREAEEMQRLQQAALNSQEQPNPGNAEMPYNSYRQQ